MAGGNRFSFAYELGLKMIMGRKDSIMRPRGDGNPFN